MVKLILYENNKIKWSQEFKNKEMLAGSVAVGIGILKSFNDSSRSVYRLDTNTDLSEYRQIKNVTEEDSNQLFLSVKLRNIYGVWFKSSDRFRYDLYTFGSNKFFQGVVSMCVNFNVDFRSYIYKFPFDSNGSEYVLSGYQGNQDYRLGVIAIELSDTEEERRDDESVLIPLVNQVNM
jgi:hypothetical protein